MIALTTYILLIPSLLPPLNGYNGVHPLYILTTCTFFVPIIIMVFMSVVLNRNHLLILNKMALLTLLTTTVPTTDSLINYSKINTGLFNPLGQYHPPLLFFVIVVGSYSMITGHNNSRWRTLSSNYIILTLILSGWWANQELFWGNYWNWDPVELSSCLILCSTVLIIHVWPAKRGVRVSRYVQFLLLICLLAYLTNRGPTANSVHQFSGTFFLKIDFIWFWLLWVSVTALIVRKSLVYSKDTGRFHKNLGQKKKPIIFSLFSIVIVLSSILAPHIIHIQPKSTAKYLILLYILVIWTLQIKPRVGIPPSTAHTITYISIAALVLYTETPTNTLYVNDMCYGHGYVLVQNSCTSVTTLDIQSNIVLVGEYKVSRKHGTVVARHGGMVSTTQCYIKSNPTSKFIVLDSNNVNKLFWVLSRYLRLI